MKSKVLLPIFILIAIAAMTVAIVTYRRAYVAEHPTAVVGWDFERVYTPVAQALVSGEDPYQVDGFYNPFWIVLPLVPFTFIPSPWGHALFAAVNIALYVFAAWKIGLRNRFALVTVTAGVALVSALVGNIEGLFLLGMILPPQIGLFFMLAKPQVGGAVALVWMWTAYRQRGMIGVSRLFLPVLGGFILSFVLFDGWFLHAPDVVAKSWNASLWPWSLLAGIPLLAAALVRRDDRLALAAGAFLTPYVTWFGYGYVAIGILSADWSGCRSDRLKV